MTDISHDEHSDVQIFHEDRSDVAVRALPRIAVGTAGWCLLVVVLVSAQGGTEALLIGLAIMGGVWVLALVTRFDVVALQCGRRIRYELHEDRFLAYRGKTLVDSFEYSDVSEWVAADAALTLWYWLGWGYWRSGFYMSDLPQYSFTLSTGHSGKRKRVTPPALFRWDDRGGLKDVTLALIQRLGPPINYSVNLRLEDPGT